MTLASLSTSDWQARASRVRYETRHFIDGKYRRFGEERPLHRDQSGDRRAFVRSERGHQGGHRCRGGRPPRRPSTRAYGAARPRATGWPCWSRSPAHRGEYRALRAARHALHGQADHRHGHHRRAGGGQEFRLLRRAHRQDRRAGDRHRAGCVPLHSARAARRRRLHRAVELSVADGGLEGRSGAGRGQIAWC